MLFTSPLYFVFFQFNNFNFAFRENPSPGWRHDPKRFCARSVKSFLEIQEGLLFMPNSAKQPQPSHLNPDLNALILGQLNGGPRGVKRVWTPPWPPWKVFCAHPCKSSMSLNHFSAKSWALFLAKFWYFNLILLYSGNAVSRWNKCTWKGTGQSAQCSHL